MRKFTKFQKITALSISLLVILIVLFLILNTFVHPKVTSILIKGGQDSALIRNQQIRLEFNRPIKRDNIADYIKINPSIEFRTIWSGNSLVVIPNQVLDSDTNYNLSISRELEDIYNEKFIEDFEFIFKTEQPKIALIEKPLNSNQEILAIYNSDLTNRQQILVRENIKYFGINENFAVIVTENNYSNNIEILNRRTNEVRSLDLVNQRVSAFSFSSSTTRNEFAYTKQDIEVKANYYLPKSKSKIYIYSLDSYSQNEFNPQGTAEDVTSLEYSNKGESLLYRTGDSFYSIAESQNPENYTGIGRFLSEGNFSKDDDDIVFIAFDPLNTYDSIQFLSVFNSNRETTKIESNNIPVLDPKFKNKTDNIVYAERMNELITTKGIYKIMETDLKGNKKELLASAENKSLELPVLSFDDRYIAIEQYTAEQLKDYQNSRNLGFQTKPHAGNIIIFDTVLNKIYDNNVLGSSVQWL